MTKKFSPYEPTTGEALEEVGASLWQIEGFEASTREHARAAVAAGDDGLAARLNAAADQWSQRASRLRRAHRILTAIWPHENEIRVYVQRLRRGEEAA